jgi:uncharacterized protein (DUF58 family)
MVLVSLPLPWLAVRGVGVRRGAPVVATAGEPFECSLQIENRGRLPRYMLEVEDRFAGDTGRVVAVRVRRGGTETVGYTVENPRRGIYAGGEVLVESRAPFGLFYGRSRMRAASDTVVYPRTFDVAGLPPSAVTDAEWGEKSESSTLHRGHGGEFWGVRDYRPGDPARLVAWKKSARGLPSGRLAVIELAQETHPPFVLAMSLDAGAPPEAREMVVSAGASLLLYAIGDGREVRADAGPENASFPKEPTRESALTWCAGLRASRPPATGGASVEIRPSTRRPGTKPGTRPGTAGESEASEQPGASEVRAVVLVSCHEFAGPGPWMSQGEELEFMQGVEARGRRVAHLGAEVSEPWRI